MKASIENHQTWLWDHDELIHMDHWGEFDLFHRFTIQSLEVRGEFSPTIPYHIGMTSSHIPTKYCTNFGDVEKNGPWRNTINNIRLSSLLKKTPWRSYKKIVQGSPIELSKKTSQYHSPWTKWSRFKMCVYNCRLFAICRLRKDTNHMSAWKISLSLYH